MRLLSLTLAALLLAGCLEAPREPERAERERSDLAPAQDGAQAPREPSEPPARDPDQYAFVLNVIPPTEEEPWAFVTVGTASTSGNRSQVRHGLNATLHMLAWDVTSEIYADVYELDAAIQKHNDTLGYYRASFWGAGGLAEFNVPASVENRTGEMRPVVSLLLSSPQSDGFIAVRLSDGGIYRMQTFTVIEDGRAEQVRAWARQDYGVMEAPAAEEESREEVPR